MRNKLKGVIVFIIAILLMVGAIRWVTTKSDTTPSNPASIVSEPMKSVTNPDIGTVLYGVNNNSIQLIMDLRLPNHKQVKIFSKLKMARVCCFKQPTVR